MPGWCTHCILKREQHFQPLQNHRWSVKLEPWRATLTGHPNTAPTSKTASDSGPAPRAVNWCYYCCFSHWEQESQPKWTPVTITGLAGPCSALLLGTGEYNYNNVCGRSKTNMLRWDQPETSPQTLTLANVSYVSLTTTEQHVHLSHKQERMNVGETSMQ